MKRPRKRVEQVGYVEGPKDGSYFLRYWSEPGGDGKRHRHAIEIGRKGQFGSREHAAASVEAAQIRRRINTGAMGQTVGQVADEYLRDRLPARANTRATAQVCIKHIVARWDRELLSILAEATESKRIEGWLDSLKPLDGQRERPMSFSAKKNVRQQLAALFDFAMQQGYIPSNVNPMERVKLVQREAANKRQTLTPKEMKCFFDDPTIPEYVKVIAQVARFTGLRISEIVGLRKDDFDLDAATVTVRRRVYRKDVAGPKSLKSGEPVPFPEELYKILSGWMKSKEFYPNFEGWLFQSPVTGRPYSADGMQLRYLVPFGCRWGIRRFGWHTFRHSYKQFMRNKGVSLDVVKRLMRHSKIETTDQYGSGVNIENLREAQAEVVRAMNEVPVAVKKRKWA